MRIIPAIDIINGKCVRLTKGDYDTQKIYGEDPLEMAKMFEGFGFRYLHLVDLDGAKSKQIVNHKVLESIAKNTKLKVDFGGGIKSISDVELAFSCGAKQITAGSMAVQQPELFLGILQKFGSKKIILGTDVLNRKIATNGWRKYAVDIEMIEFICSYEQKGIEYLICTDISKDGMLQGPATDLYAETLNQTNLKLIASGGCSSIEEIKELKKIGCEGVIIGKAIYENKINLKELAELC
ncbi:MAG: 1-(5-phosphoribosyl)-5-[(5-phosphoribosylamino)methylideneamino]imidazole-4-carboxamide isomerase [Bacteroidetes bacterium HGW-Bacteroidetes-17]|jgi:phosphoribosylformimino-5-aminoimidazole carboxamide ribotide isomerase|nr:MAG: 1-(5-phosphoribosyl)-5-[(5-phosphoribosylamino)methylideneamino]imidazole-4-carboxamide isomerase [Bacteroidetes bacterium HGW-Bacteroidetes-17]